MCANNAPPAVNHTESPAQQFLTLTLQAQTTLPELIRSRLIQLAKSGDHDVKALFFPQESDPDATLACYGQEFSVRYAAYILAVCRQAPDLAALIQDASYTGIKNWVISNGAIVGRAIYRQYLLDSLEIPKTTQEADAYFQAIIDTVTTTGFVRVTEAISATMSPVPAQMILEGFCALGGKGYNAIILSWEKSEFFRTTFEGQNLFQLLLSYPWLYEYKVDLIGSQLSPAIEKKIGEQHDAVRSWIVSPCGPREYGLLRL